MLFRSIGKACTLKVAFSAAGTGTGKFSISVDNNTSGSANSILGASSRVQNITASTIAAGEASYTFSLAAPTANYTAGQGSFLTFRTDSSAAVSFSGISLSCI